MSRVRNSSKPTTLTRAGQAVVEFALVLPILLMLLVGIIQFGVLLNTQQIITNAAWEGARAGAIARDPSLADQEVIGAAQRAGFTLDTNRLMISITPKQNDPPRSLPGPMPRGQPITVTLSYSVTLNIPFEFDFPVNATAVTRIEYSNP